MYLQKVISKIIYILFVVILKVTDEQSRVRSQIRKSEVRIRGSGSVPICHGSGTPGKIKEREEKYPEQIRNTNRRSLKNKSLMQTLHKVRKIKNEAEGIRVGGVGPHPFPPSSSLAHLVYSRHITDTHSHTHTHRITCNRPPKETHLCELVCIHVNTAHGKE
jgi:hypothetical protein